jgi:hypothetical protein
MLNRYKRDEVLVSFIRKEYDIKLVVNAIIKSNLPSYFAEKLMKGE